MIIPEIKNGTYVFNLPKDVNFDKLTISCHPVITDIINGLHILFIPIRSITSITYDSISFVNTGQKDLLVTASPQCVYSVEIPAPKTAGATVTINVDNQWCCPIWIS